MNFNLVNLVKETHLRTMSKAVVYRISTVITVMAVAYFIFNDLSVAGGMGLTAVIMGTSVYYLHDRLWLLLGWDRNEDGKDGVIRSTIKMITYRVLIMFAIALSVKLVTAATNNQASNEQIINFVLIQTVINLFFYFLIERLSNLVSWGKIKKIESETGEK